MTNQFEKNAFRFGFVLFLIAATWSIWDSKNSADPLAKYYISGRGNPPQAIADDYHNFIQQLPIKERQNAGGITVYEDGHGKYAVDFEVNSDSDNVSWHYALIYDNANKRIKVIKNRRRRYMS